MVTQQEWIAALRKRIAQRDAHIEDIILNELKKGALQAWPIVEVVKKHMGKVPERMVLRRIYSIMGVDTDLIPATPNDDYILL